MQNRSRCGFVEAASRQKEGKDEMIISASRRTDIPACYGQWMMARLRAGEVLVPNPYNASRISRVALSPGNVDCIVFWTKNAAPMLPLLDELDALGYKYYLTPQHPVQRSGPPITYKKPSRSCNVWRASLRLV